MIANSAYLQLLRVFEFAYDGSRIPLPLGSQRLLALLALNPRGVHRGAAAEQLWPDCTPSRAAANLRSALCRGRRIRSVTVIDSSGHRLRLSPAVDVDLHALRAAAQQHSSRQRPLPADCDPLVGELDQELLPGWPDEWLSLERQHWDQARLHALESIAQQLQETGAYLLALQAAMTAIDIDPIRESAHRIVIEIHSAEGNTACALKHYQSYRELLRQELETLPSPHMTRLVEELSSA
ncbi:BTAD domain-containing putative transcriptional regulator [Streptomyces sp. NPDC048644]|uniref:AfsR/SARP family transcriptional regulator n=1 Tax=Streptomyces sp. NPDC048644 TaxID=3365582 RepID=UPI0037233378